MKTKIETIQQLNDFLWKHPAVKSALRETERDNRKRASKGSKITSSNPKEWIKTATALDPRVGALINATRRVRQCQKEGRAQLRKKIRGRKSQKTLDPQYLYKWAGIEHDYQRMVGLSYDLVATNPLIAGVAKAAKEIDDVHRFANPAFLDRSHIRLLKEVGADPDELADLYRYGYLPTRKRMDAKLRSNSEKTLLAEGQKNVNKLAFLYAPERLVEEGILKLGGSDVASLAATIAGVSASIAWCVQQLNQTAAAMGNAPFWVWVVLWLIWNDQQNKLADLVRTHSLLQSQYDQEMAQLAQENAPASTATEEKPNSVATEFGYVIGNMSRSKMEVHLPNCGFLRLIRSEHVRAFQTLALARDAGLDNCYYCIGGSTR